MHFILNVFWNSVFLIAFLVVIITLFLFQSRRPHGSPPGPIMLPLLGNLPILLQGNLIEISEKLKATYGSIFSLSLGGKWVVFINGNEYLREVFVKNADFFSDRQFSSLTRF